MRKIFLFVFVGIVIALVWFIGCEPEYPSSPWNPGDKGKPSPVIISVDPLDGVFAGVDEITIKGKIFSSSLEENLVFFNGIQGTVQFASDTHLVVISPPIITGDSIKIQLSVIGAYLFAEFPNDSSECQNYVLEDAVVEYGIFDDYDDAYGIACDANETLYVSLVGKKIVQITPDGERYDYATTSFDKASAMKIGPGGDLYYVNILQYIFRIPSGGGKDELFAMLPGGVYDLDFDSLGNIYCGGSGNAIYRVKPDGSKETVAEYPYINITSVRVFYGYVYIAGDYKGDDSTQVQVGIWRNQIVSSDEDLGPNELVFDWGTYSANSKIKAITFSSDGDMYIGADIGDGITIRYIDGTLEPLYPNLTHILYPSAHLLCWGNSQFLYVNRRAEGTSGRRIIRIDTRKNGAPYYGRK